MFLASNICWVSSGTVTARYCWLPRAVKGANPVMKKWRRGKGTKVHCQLRNSNEKMVMRTHVDSQLPQIRVELTRETQASGNSGHNNRNEMVKITICWCRELECPETNIIKCLVVNAESFVRVFNKLMYGKSGVIGLKNNKRDSLNWQRHTYLDDGIRNLGTGYDGIGTHHSVGVLLSNFWDQEGTHTSTSTSTKRMGNLEACHVKTLKTRPLTWGILAHPEDNQYPQPLYEPHPKRHLRVRHPPCSLKIESESM